MANSEINALVKTLKQMKASGIFSPYIDYIVFPKYRRMAENERINFEFPLTVLVGKNGSGKSSLLHALAGAPHGYSVGNYWFGTKVDPIDELPTSAGGKQKLAEEQRARFWYGYTQNNEECQAIKQRVRKIDDPDYWEPSRFAAKYGMTKKPPEGKDRHDQIRMDAIFLSLRLYLSAFDRCFHFMGGKTLIDFQGSDVWKNIVAYNQINKPDIGGKTKLRQKANRRDYIRHKSKRLELALKSQKETTVGKNNLSNAPEKLSEILLETVSTIVGKKYTTGWLIRHRFYESWGESVRFITDSGQYTEANAGSGETAVVMIVRLFEKAKPHSLILLDEPETSLHPGAQTELLKYILTQIKVKKLQVVLSTHAPAFVRQLPMEAIKVLQPTADGYVKINEHVHPQEAFHEIGHDFDPNCNIIVEDRLAKAILDGVAAKQNKAFAARVIIEYGMGGDSAMKKNISIYSKNATHRPIFIFDGDKKHSHVDPDKLPVDNISPKKLDEIIKLQTGVRVDFDQNSKMSEASKAEVRVEYLKYYRDKVFYLPFNSPDQAIWSEDAARNYLLATLLLPSDVEAVMAAISQATDFKDKFAKLSNAMGGIELSSLHSMFLTRFLAHEMELVAQVLQVLNVALTASENINA